MSSIQVFVTGSVLEVAREVVPLLVGDVDVVGVLAGGLAGLELVPASAFPADEVVVDPGVRRLAPLLEPAVVPVVRRCPGALIVIRSVIGAGEAGQSELRGRVGAVVRAVVDLAQGEDLLRPDAPLNRNARTELVARAASRRFTCSSHTAARSELLLVDPLRVHPAE